MATDAEADMSSPAVADEVNEHAASSFACADTSNTITSSPACVSPLRDAVAVEEPVQHDSEGARPLRDAVAVEESAQQDSEGAGPIRDGVAVEECAQQDSKGADPLRDAVAVKECTRQDSEGLEQFPGDDQLRIAIAELITSIDSLDSLTAGKVRHSLENKFGRKDGAFDVIKVKIGELLRERVASLTTDTKGEDYESIHTNGAAKKVATPMRQHRTKTEANTVRYLRQLSAERKRQKRPREEKQEPDTDESHTKCPRFSDDPLEATIGGQSLTVLPRQFGKSSQSGSWGYFGSQRMQVDIEGKKIEMQCVIHCAVVGSDEDGSADAPAGTNLTS